MKIAEELIPHINLALDIQLRQNQIEYLIKDRPMNFTRANGKTLAHMIKLALSEGDPLNMKTPEEWSDYGNGTIEYARQYYRREFYEVWFRLKNYGFKVRELQYLRGGNNI